MNLSVIWCRVSKSVSEIFISTIILASISSDCQNGRGSGGEDGWLYEISHRGCLWLAKMRSGGNEIKPTNLHRESESVLVMNEIKLSFFMNKMKAKRQKKPRLNRDVIPKTVVDE